jgi:transcriptional regulator with XRE-family HTH domain
LSLRYDEIGQRLRVFRLQSGMNVDEIATKIGISRTALYRFEKGEVVKIETLLRLAELLGVSLPTLLGVEIEYISSAVTYFERVWQLEEKADRIVAVSGPFTYLLASNNFLTHLPELLRETASEPSRPEPTFDHDVKRILEILVQRRRSYEQRRPTIVNVISALDVERVLRLGLIGKVRLSPDALAERRRRARMEIEHLARIAEAEPIGVQIGVATDTLPHVGFQIFRSAERQVLAISPFRLDEQPNIRFGVAMITSSDNAVAQHQKVMNELWERALKGKEAARYLRELIAAVETEHTIVPAETTPMR